MPLFPPVSPWHTPANAATPHPPSAAASPRRYLCDGGALWHRAVWQAGAGAADGGTCAVTAAAALTTSTGAAAAGPGVEGADGLA